MKWFIKFIWPLLVIVVAGYGLYESLFGSQGGQKSDSLAKARAAKAAKREKAKAEKPAEEKEVQNVLSQLDLNVQEDDTEA